MSEPIKISICSGYFNPLLPHHLDYLSGATKFGHVVVIINNDRQVELKGSYNFLNQRDRTRMVGSLKDVYMVYTSIDENNTVVKSLEELHRMFTSFTQKYELTFCNGGDRLEGNTSSAEEEFCVKNNIRLEYGVGGKNKTGSSSQTLQNFLDRYWVEAKSTPRMSSLDMGRGEFTTTFGGGRIPSYVRY